MASVPFAYRSLYWRIGIGFIVCIASVLAVQGAALLWLLSRAEPDRTPFTKAISEELGVALSVDPTLDVHAFVVARYPTSDPFYVITTAGDVFYFGDRSPSATAVNAVREEFRHEHPRAIPQFWQTSPYWASPLVVNGELAGIVSMVARNQVQELWPRMALLAIALLVAGTVLASRFIFGPAQRRLRALEITAERLGAGDADARAAEDGGDEVASLAHTFNVMADDLAARALQIHEFDQTRRLLLADISHELLTPLTAIRGYQEKLASDSAISGAAHRRRYVDIIGEEAQRVERIVRDLLDLARFESGGDGIDIQDVSIEGLFGRVAARQEADAAERGVKLTTTIDPGAEIVRGDQFRLEQALQNLAANALRHVPEGGRVELHAALSGADTIVTVRDTGAGIAREHLPYIFNRFYKVDASRKSGVEGSGLGLSIVKAIVERHHGTITVVSQPDVETVFTIRLPGNPESALDRTA